MKRLLAVIIIVTFLAGIFSGCYDRREVDDLAYVIAIGLDKGKTNKLKLTLQLAVPKSIGGSGQGGGGGAGGGGGTEASTVITLETPSFMAGLNLANNVISRQMNISHAKVMVFSEELAKEDISNYIYGFARVRELRPSTYMIVARGTAEDYIRSVKPPLESNPAKYYELNLQSHNYTGFTASTTFFEFYKGAKSSFIQAVATLAGVNPYKSSDEITSTLSTYKEKGYKFPLEGDYFAGEIPRVSDLRSEIMGLGVFNGGRLVGELDGQETTYYLMAKGQYKHSTFTLTDPIDEKTVVLMDIKQSRAPVNKVELRNGKPLIFSKISLEADIQAIQSGINYEKPSKRLLLERAYEDFIRKGIEKMLKKTSNEFGTDIIGYGQIAKRKFLTWKEWKDYNWFGKYNEAEFSIQVDVKIRRPGLILRNTPIITNKGGSRE